MASEITVSASLASTKSATTPGLSKSSLRFTQTGARHVRMGQNVGTSEEALGVGDLPTLGWAAFFNTDGTNPFFIRSGTGGTNLIEVEAGAIVLFKFPSTVTAPYVIASGGAVNIEYCIYER